MVHNRTVYVPEYQRTRLEYVLIRAVEYTLTLGVSALECIKSERANSNSTVLSIIVSLSRARAFHAIGASERVCPRPGVRRVLS